MKNIGKKTKIRIEKVQLYSQEEVKTFEIHLPANVSKIKAITITSSL